MAFAAPPGTRAVTAAPGLNRSGASLQTSTTTSPASPWARATDPTRMGSSGSSVGNLEHGPAVQGGGRRGEKRPQGVRGLSFPADHLPEIRRPDPERVDRGLPRHALVHVNQVRMIHQVPRAVFDEGLELRRVAHFLDFFAFFAFAGLAPPLAFRALAFALVLAFFALALVAFRGFRGAWALAFAFFALGALGASAAGASTIAARAGRREAGACLAIMTSTDSEGRAPRRIHCSNLPVSTMNFAGSVSGS